MREREGRLKRERGAHSGRGETKVGGRGRRNSNVQQKLLFMHSLRKEKKKTFFSKRAKSRNEFQVLVNYM